jgi:hypothetical protein
MWQERGVLIEGCEVFEARMRDGEDELAREEQMTYGEHIGGEPMIID